MWAISWSVKASKLCQLRCRYCYEWNDLANPQRISLEGWERILVAVRRYHELQTERFGEAGQTRIYWHGGEPLLLPLEYLEAVVRLEREILGHDGVCPHVTNFVQTNLYALPAAKLDFLERERFELGVSHDVVEGQRLTEGGLETGERVVANMDRLRERGIGFAGAVVLAGHTRDRLREIYDFYEERKTRFSLFALSPSPLGTAGADFSVTDTEIVDALKDLFLYTLERGAPIPVQPLQTYFETALLHMTGLERMAYDRTKNGDRLLVVDTDGRVYPLSDRYASHGSIGNVLEEPLDTILASGAYAESLERDDDRRSKHCGGCPYVGACDTHPLFDEPYRGGRPRCRAAFEVIPFIEHTLREAGFTEDALRDLALQAVLPSLSFDA